AVPEPADRAAEPMQLVAPEGGPRQDQGRSGGQGGRHKVLHGKRLWDSLHQPAARKPVIRNRIGRKSKRSRRLPRKASTGRKIGLHHEGVSAMQCNVTRSIVPRRSSPWQVSMEKTWRFFTTRSVVPHCGATLRVAKLTHYRKKRRDQRGRACS